MSEPEDFYRAYHFRMEIDGVITGHLWNAGPFKMTVNGIEVPVAVGTVIEDIPGQVKMQPLTVEGPATVLLGLYNMFKATVDIATGLGENEPSLRQDIDFIQLNRDGSDMERKRVFGAWGADYEVTKFDKKENDVRREILELRARYFERQPV